MQINYVLKRSMRKTIGLKIVDGVLYVNAPLLTPKTEIDRVVIQHQGWIEKNMNNPKIKINTNFETDDYIYLLGKKYKLIVLTGCKKDMKIINDFIYLYGKSFESIEKNFRDYQKSIIQPRVEAIQRQLNVYFETKYRVFKGKWGCCFYNKNQISLNYLLACLPEYCIDEVIYHEITHFKVHTHQKQFYNELVKICPNYKKIVKEMKNYML